MVAFVLIMNTETPLCLVQEDARADAVDCVVRDIQNTQCLLNVEYVGSSSPQVTLQFTDSKDDVGLGLVKEGLVMVDVRKEKHLQKMVSSLLLPLTVYIIPVPAAAQNNLQTKLDKDLFSHNWLHHGQNLLINSMICII